MYYNILHTGGMSMNSLLFSSLLFDEECEEVEEVEKFSPNMLIASLTELE
jgi:hypothetical protein